MKIEIDFAFAVGSKLLLGGWAVVGDDISKHQLQFEGSPSELLMFKRGDVSEVMQCQEKHCSGFLVSLNNTSKKIINVTWGEFTGSVDLDSVVFTRQLLEIDALPKECMDAATTLLEHNGFFWGQYKGGQPIL